ncbi:hypothetical protein RND71_007628 [Anisodus tanguticus]|uniref:Beta-hexosaminidase n=1 Tax=Anisodus tanguticus TaxID=243964 RepID=A0AAE1SM63_9SOLA|nr:hypothetical protein RND71_007628 [Anisodus tanguticus]
MRGEKTFSSFLPLISLSFFIFISQSIATNYPINVWPKPTTFNWPNPKSILLSPNFTISHPDHRYLTPAVNRYRQLILSEHHRPIITPAINLTSSTPLQNLIISVSDVTSPLSHGVNESYSLSTPSDGSSSAYITPATVWGAMRGLETFSQLAYGKNPIRVTAGVYVHDLPIFIHRGVMLDTSRNFYGVDDLLRLIKALSMNKLNVFHWHITDSHSFPLLVPSEPELAGKGAYGNDMMYSPADVQKIVEFGLEHGVRVLPEIDMPAHTGSWAEAYPEIITCANMFWWPAGNTPALAAEPGTGQLNPLIPKTYEVTKNVIHDTIAMFPDSLFHGGADEINSACWNTDPSIQKVVASNGTLNYYYLDCGHGSFVGNDSRYDQPPGTDQGNGGSWCGPFKTWETIYNYDITYGLTDKEAQLVIGGEVALWSEQADSTVMDSRIWPRASAMAETLWSGNRDETGMKRYAEATDRLNEWRYRMVARGIGAEPIQPLWMYHVKLAAAKSVQDALLVMTVKGGECKLTDYDISKT